MKIKSCLTVNSLLDSETQFLRHFSSFWFSLPLYSSSHSLTFVWFYHYIKKQTFWIQQELDTFSWVLEVFFWADVGGERTRDCALQDIARVGGSVDGVFTFPLITWRSFLLQVWIFKWTQDAEEALSASGYQRRQGPGWVFIYTAGKRFTARLLHGLGWGLVINVVPH